MYDARVTNSSVELIPTDEYAQLAKQFKPRKFGADAWAQLAKEAGAKYMVLTTRHHDGFCLFDSKASMDDFTSVRSAAGRDFVAEYVEAVRRAGLKVGFYYSWLDWRFPGYFDVKGNPKSAKAMVAQAHAQIEELMTNYGKIDILWYDGGWVPGLQGDEIAEFWGAKKVNAMLRKLQPHIIINNRSGLPEDLDTPEQHVTASAAGRGWESCMTMGDSCGWGYIHNNPNFKTVTQYPAPGYGGERRGQLPAQCRTETRRHHPQGGTGPPAGDGPVARGERRVDLWVGALSVWRRDSRPDDREGQQRVHPRIPLAEAGRGNDPRHQEPD